MVTKKGPKPQKETRPINEVCAEEINALLRKYNCDIHCQPQLIHGQTVYFAVIVELPKQEPPK